MRCPACQHDNRAERRFCAECGAALATICAACGTSNEPGEKFCGGCGVALSVHPAHAAENAEARKVVTIVFADLIGSTSLHERVDAESARRLMDQYYQALRDGGRWAPREGERIEIT